MNNHFCYFSNEKLKDSFSLICVKWIINFMQLTDLNLSIQLVIIEVTKLYIFIEMSWFSLNCSSQLSEINYDTILTLFSLSQSHLKWHSYKIFLCRKVQSTTECHFIQRSICFVLSEMNNLIWLAFWAV